MSPEAWFSTSAYCSIGRDGDVGRLRCATGVTATTRLVTMSRMLTSLRFGIRHEQVARRIGGSGGSHRARVVPGQHGLGQSAGVNKGYTTTTASMPSPVTNNWPPSGIETQLIGPHGERQD